MNGLTEQQRAKLRKLALEDTFFFAKVVLGYGDHVQVDPHEEVCEFLDQTALTRRMILCPRGTHKSFLTRAWAIQQAMRNPNIRILYVMSSESMAKKAGAHVDGVFKNATLLRYLFPDIVPSVYRDLRWNVTEKTVLRSMDYPEPTFQFVGTGTKVVGGHFDIIILDDFIEQEAAESEAVMESSIVWVGNCEPTLADKHSQMVVVGTRWSLKDYYGRVMGSKKQLTKERIFRAEGDRRFVVYKASDINPDGSPYFPSKFSVEYLADVKASLETQGQGHMYYFWYKNDPIDESACVFKRGWIKYWEAMGSGNEDNPTDKMLLFNPGDSPYVISMKDLRLTMTVDPAFGQKRQHDKSAICVVGSHPRGYRLNVYSWKGRVPANELVDKIFSVCKGFKKMGKEMAAVAIERVAGQDALNYWIMEKQRKEKFFIPLYRELKTSTKISKEDRIRASVPWVANGKWYTHRAFMDCNEEMETFPNGAEVNWLDAWAYQNQIWGFPEEDATKPDWSEAYWDEDLDREEKAEGPPVLGYGG